MSCDACKAIFTSTVKLAPPDANNKESQYVGQHHKEIIQLCHAAQNHCRICGDVWRYFFHPTTPEQYDVHGPVFWNGTSVGASTSGHVYFGSGTIYRFRKASELESLGVPKDAVLLDFLLSSPMNQDREMLSFLIQPATTPEMMQMTLLNPQERQSSSGGIAMVDGSFREQQRWMQAAKWFMTCIRTHNHCSEQPAQKDFLPTRLLQIPEESSDGIMCCKLIDAAEVKDRSTAFYMTLSHVWGVRKASWSTTVENVQTRMQDGIAAKDLPKTFQDAVITTRKLGVKLLWIDTLCIIQDDEDDKAKEISRMTDIYMNSILNLSATSAISSYDGLTSSIELHPRLTGTAWSGDLQAGLYRIIDLNFWRNRIDDAKINSRGWVLQERSLAPRVLHFAFDQLVWDCCELAASEEFPAGLPPVLRSDASYKTSIRRLREPRFTSSWTAEMVEHRKQMYQMWASTVMQYARCDLTYPSDKLIAVSGLARAVAGQLKDDTYLAGLWKNNILPQLLWYVSGMRSHLPAPRAAGLYSRDYGVSARAKDYRAPSWSWASVDGLIKMNGYLDCQGGPNIPDDGSRLPSTIEPVAVCLSASVTNIDLTDRFSAVTAGRLIMQGRFYRLMIKAGKYSSGLVATFKSNDERVFIKYDEPQDVTNLENVFFLPLLIKQFSWESQTAELERQGKASQEAADIHDNLAESHQEPEDADVGGKYKHNLSRDLNAMEQPGYYDAVCGLVICPTKDQQAFCRIGMIETQKQTIQELDQHAGLPALGAVLQTKEALEIFRPSKAAEIGEIFEGTFELI